MKKITGVGILTVFGLAAGFMAIAPTGVIPKTASALAAQDDHDDHDEHNHAAPAERGHEDEDDHGDEHGHEGEDDHEGEGVVKMDRKLMDEFAVTVQVAGSRALGETIQVPGEVVFNADLIAHVTPSVAGIVQRVNRSVGDRVEAGEVMAVLNSRELAAARSEYLAAETRLELARKNLVRDERLFKDKIGTERKVLESRQAAQEAQIALDLADQNLHALGLAEDEVRAALETKKHTSLSRYELCAPISGVVIARELTRGEVVSEQPKESPFIVADLSSVWVDLTVYQRDLARVRAGMPVRIAFGHGVPDANGQIAWVSPALDEATRTATARLVLENPRSQWRPGLFVTGHIVVEKATAAVVVPRTALQVVDGNTVIFVETDEGYDPRPVVVGRSNATDVEIVEGLSRGDRYVSNNAFTLKAKMQEGSFGDGHGH